MLTGVRQLYVNKCHQPYAFAVGFIPHIGGHGSEFVVDCSHNALSGKNDMCRQDSWSILPMTRDLDPGEQKSRHCVHLWPTCSFDHSCARSCVICADSYHKQRR
jgi:hypothetical protein